MAFTYTVTDASNRSSIVRGDVGLVSGTWRGSAVIVGTIVPTGGSVILCHGLTVGSAAVSSGTAKMVHSLKNTDGNRAAKNNMIGVFNIDPANEVTGDWWAIVTV